MPPLPPLTQALILVNVAVFCLDQFLGPWFTALFALWPLGGGWLPWQPLSYAFLHDGLFHLLFNMLGLWMFGAELERLWGPRRFLVFYGASVLAAAVAQLLVAALLGSPNPTVGASGGLFGLLMAYGMLFPYRTVMLLLPPIPMKARTFVAVFGAIELILGVTAPTGGVAHFAHLGGMVGGWLTIRAWRGQAPFGRRRR